MSRHDIVLVTLVAVAFATLVTVHLRIIAGLLARPRKWRAPLVLVVAPLAPYYALREKMRPSAVMWLGALATYVTARVLAAA